MKYWMRTLATVCRKAKHDPRLCDHSCRIPVTEGWKERWSHCQKAANCKKQLSFICEHICLPINVYIVCMGLHILKNIIFNTDYLDWLHKDYATIFKRLIMKQCHYRFKHNILLYYGIYPKQKESSTDQNNCSSVEAKSSWTLPQLLTHCSILWACVLCDT